MRTVILERRPVSVVAKAMDVLVTSYSHSIKTGSYFKGLKNERTSPSTVPSANSPMTSSDVSTNRIDGLGKSSRQESPARIDSRSLDRSSTSPASESDISSFEASIMNRARISGAENANDMQSSSLRHQLPGSSDNSINPNISEQQDSQLTSPAISPDEMYRFVFAPVEEEMVGDPAYLVSIIVEFLRRLVYYNDLVIELYFCQTWLEELFQLIMLYATCYLSGSLTYGLLDDFWFCI